MVKLNKTYLGQNIEKMSHRLDPSEISHNMTRISERMSHILDRKPSPEPLNNFQVEILSFMARKGPVSQTEISKRLRSKEMNFSYIHRMMKPLEKQGYIKWGDTIKTEGNDSKIFHLTVYGFYSALSICKLWDKVDEVFEKWREVFLNFDPILIGKWKYLANSDLRGYLIETLKGVTYYYPLFVMLQPEKMQAESYRRSFFDQALIEPIGVMHILNGPEWQQKHPGVPVEKARLKYHEMWSTVIRGDKELLLWITDTLTQEAANYQNYIIYICHLLRIINGEELLKKLLPLNIKTGDDKVEISFSMNLKGNTPPSTEGSS